MIILVLIIGLKSVILVPRLASVLSAGVVEVFDLLSALFGMTTGVFSYSNVSLIVSSAFSGNYFNIFAQ